MKHLLKEFNLPGYLKGDSFAKDSKRIQDKYKDSNNRDDKETEMELLDRLRQAQEYVKSIQNPSPNGSTEEQSSQNQLAVGGAMINDNTNPAPLAGEGAGAGAGSGAIAAGAGGADMIGGMMTKSAQRESGRVDTGKNTAGMAMKGAAAGAIAGSVVPGIGTAIGAAVGTVGGAAAGFFGAKSQNRKVDRLEVKAGREQYKDLTSRFALGGSTDTPCGGVGQPPCPDMTNDIANAPIDPLDMADLQQMNEDSDGAIQFSESEQGVSAMNNLFQAAPAPVEKASVDYGKYGPVNYFEQDVADPSGLTLTRGSGQIHNEDAVQRQFKSVQQGNPGLKLKYNAMGGKIDYAVGGSTEEPPCGGPGQPPCRKQELEGQEVIGDVDLTYRPSEKAQALLDRNIEYLGTPKKKSTTSTKADKPQSTFEAANTSFEDFISQKEEYPDFLTDYSDVKGLADSQRNGFSDTGLSRMQSDEALIGPDTIGIDDELSVDTGSAEELAAYETQGELSTKSLAAQKDLQKLSNQELLAQGLKKGKDGIITAARGMPAIMNAIQLAKLKKPKAEGYARLNTRYKKQLVDEQALQNIVKESTAGAREAIIGASGGSGSAARANLVGSQLQSTKALSDAYLKASGENRAERAREQQFNLGVDKINIDQSNRETRIKAMNEGAYDTNKSKLLAAMGDDIGKMGKEAFFKKYPEMMGMDFDSKGEFILTDEEKKALRASRLASKNKK